MKKLLGLLALFALGSVVWADVTPIPGKSSPQAQSSFPQGVVLSTDAAHPYAITFPDGTTQNTAPSGSFDPTYLENQLTQVAVDTTTIAGDVSTVQSALSGKASSGTNADITTFQNALSLTASGPSVYSVTLSSGVRIDAGGVRWPDGSVSTTAASAATVDPALFAAKASSGTNADITELKSASTFSPSAAIFTGTLGVASKYGMGDAQKFCVGPQCNKSMSQVSTFGNHIVMASTNSATGNIHLVEFHTGIAAGSNNIMARLAGVSRAFGAASGTHIAGMDIKTGGTDSVGALGFNAGFFAATQRMYLDGNSGNLSIGLADNTAGSDRLHVGGAIRSNTYFNGGDGSVGSPAYQFTNQGSLGLYRSALDELSFSAGGVQAAKVNKSGLVSTYGVSASTITSSSFISNGPDGSISGSWMGFSASNPSTHTARIDLGNVSGTNGYVNIWPNNVNGPGVNIDSNGYMRVGFGGGSPTSNIDSVTNIRARGYMSVGAGSKGLPGYNFWPSLTTGLYESASGEMSVAASNVQIASFSASGVTTTLPFKAATGRFTSAGDATYSVTASSSVRVDAGGYRFADGSVQYTAAAGHGDGTDCPSGQVAVGVDASGNAQCAVVDATAINGSTNAVQSDALFDHGALTGSSAHGATNLNTAGAIVARDGSGDFKANVIRHGNGAVGAPSMTFDSYPTLGWYKSLPVPDEFSGAVGGAQILRVDKAGIRSFYGVSASTAIFTGIGNTTYAVMASSTIAVFSGGYRFADGSVQYTAAVGHGDGTDCPSGEVAVGVDASGNAQCAVVDATAINGSTNAVQSDALFDHAALTGTSAHGAASANTANAIVSRDASGNFSAGTITASITGSVSGNAGTATALAANGSDAPSGYVCRGVDASGNCESALVDATQVSGSTNPVASNALYSHTSATGGSGVHGATSLNTSNAIVARNVAGMIYVGGFDSNNTGPTGYSIRTSSGIRVDAGLVRAPSAEFYGTGDALYSIAASSSISVAAGGYKFADGSVQYTAATGGGGGGVKASTSTEINSNQTTTSPIISCMAGSTVTLTTSGGSLIANANFTLLQTGVQADFFIGIIMDGVLQSLSYQNAGGVLTYQGISHTKVITNVPAGTHSLCIGWGTNAGTIYAERSGGVYEKTTFDVQEL